MQTSQVRKRCFDLSVLDLSNAINKVKMEIKQKNDISIAYITIIFEMNTIMNQVSKCADWLNGLAKKLLDKLKKKKLIAELSNMRMKRKDYPEVLSRALSAIDEKCEDSRVSFDETEWVAALITAASKFYLSSINSQKGQLE